MAASVSRVGVDNQCNSASRDVDRQKDASLDEISRRLQKQPTCETSFSLHRRVT